MCRLADLAPERGAAALLADGDQVALFRLVDDRVLAVQQHDPFSDAYVISRGIVGSRRSTAWTYRRSRRRCTSRCSTWPRARAWTSRARRRRAGSAPDLRTWPVRVRDGLVEVAS